MINNLAAMELIWNHVFVNELRFDLNEHCVLLSETPMNPISNRKKIAEHMFEVYRDTCSVENIKMLTLK